VVSATGISNYFFCFKKISITYTLIDNSRHTVCYSYFYILLEKIMNTNISSISERVYIAARGAESQESDDLGRFLAVRGAVVRALRREFGLPRHGLAPITVFHAAHKYADCVAVFPGSADHWAAAERGIKPALRRMARRAKKGTL
jgi:hypothetical protein